MNLHPPAIVRKVLAKDLPRRLVELIVIDFMARKRVIKWKVYQRGKRCVFHFFFFFLKAFFSAQFVSFFIFIVFFSSLLRDEKRDEENDQKE